MSTRLTQDFYAQNTIAVARALLGRRLVRRLDDGTRLSGRIVETEAYLGIEDQAAHSFGGRRTARTEVMFGPPGVSYIYFIYGMYFCANVVTAPRGTPEAVLVRALALSEGVEEVQRHQPGRPIHQLANGPGKLCKALRLTRDQNALDLTQSQVLWIEDGEGCPERQIVDGPRIGLGDAFDAVHWPLRFGVKGDLALSPAKFPADFT